MNGHQVTVPHRSNRPRGYVLIVALALVTAACTSNSDAASPMGATGSGSTSGGATGAGSTVTTISQPPVPAHIPVAPQSERVDLTMPTFSDPTNITNALFPVSLQESVLMLGHVEGKPFRTEVTLLPETRIIEWDGQRVETLVSQYNAFLDGRIEEVAYDYYAQADDGSVWYFGEDVFDFRAGAIVVTEGTWLAGRDGPAAMIMPADPQVGDVYRTENAPGFVFEEVTVRSTDESLDGPVGPIEGGMLADELHSDGKTEQKVFAPGYGEFYTAGGGDVEALALAIPTDASTEPLPVELTTMSNGALDVFDLAGSGDWAAATATVREIEAAWKTFRAAADVPRLIEPRMNLAVVGLARAVRARGNAAARDAAIQAARSSFDLQLPYRSEAEIDLARMDLWAAQLLVDEAAGDAGGVGADAFALDYVRDRIRAAVDPRDLVRINTEIGTIQVAVVDGELGAAAAAAERLRATLADLQPLR
ncbi:MAG TPA: hypothetical protein VFM40_08590 [Actinomycetota bacterium]|nr:hypothetical protein [Actinomycetota bacterium]